MRTIWPDVEAEVIAAYEAGLPAYGYTGCIVRTRIPSNRPPAFWRVLRTGGPRETLVTEGALVTTEAWADTETAAVQMINAARSVLFDLNGVLFGVSEYGGPVNLPDPTTDAIRYTASHVIRARARIIA